MRKDARTTRTRLHGSLPVMVAALLAGDLLVQCLPALPPVACLLALLPLVPAAWRWPWLRPLLFLLLGFAWACLRAGAALDARLPAELAGQDFDVVGVVRDLPRHGDGASRFQLQVQQVRLNGQAVALDGALRLAWYGPGGEQLKPCQRWRLHLRLQPSRAMVDPGTWDSEKYALERGVAAVGYVRAEGPNELLSGEPWCVDRLRDAISDAIRVQLGGGAMVPLLQALAVGDQRGLSDHHWQVARVTGVTHLLAISGFHIGVAALLGAWLVGWLWRALPYGSRMPPRQVWQAVAALAVALGYALLAGWGLPAQRTVLMIAAVCVARVLRRGSRPLDSLSLALLVILVADPLAILSAGLWLSFAGVALLIYGMIPGRGWRAWFTQLGRAQGLMTVGLLPLTVWFFGQASVLGAPVNLVAVPVVSLGVVPLALLGIVAWFVWPAAAGVLWQLAAWLMQALWQGLELCASWPLAQWFVPQASWWALLLALLGGLWLLLPRGLPVRWLGLLLFLPLLWPRPDVPAPGAFRVVVLDVGQGLSVLVRTREHALLYDAGPRFPSGFDVGEAVVLPALRALGVRQLDMLMVSHGDNDHDGGAPAVARAMPAARVLGSEPGRTSLPMSLCRAGRHWRWDGVAFRILHPVDAWPEGSNNGSCVLLVTGAGGRMLLPGDISRLVEPAVGKQVGPGPPLVLLVPHHGSNSSSRASFLRRLQPTMAVVSAGWHNRFGHPADEVVVRYRAADIALYNTARAGAVSVAFPATAPPRLRWRLRCDRRHYWRASSCREQSN